MSDDQVTELLREIRDNQGEVVFRSGRHKTQSPLILHVDSGGIMSAVSSSEI